MVRSTSALGFLRLGSFAALLAILLSACELTTAPRFPEEEKTETETEDDG